MPRSFLHWRLNYWFIAILFEAAVSAQPRIDSVSPTEGPITGGTIVTIRGSALAAATIAVDRRAVTPLVQSDEEIRLQMPPRDNGYAVIRLRSSNGVAYAEYLYVPPTLGSTAPGSITTVAGVGAFAGDGRVATQAMLDPTNLAFDGNEVFILEPSASRIRRISADGRIDTFAGNGADGFTPDGQDATTGGLWNPRGIEVDGESVIIAESFSHRVRRIDKRTGIITTIAGKNNPHPSGGFSGDGGPAVAAELRFPSQVLLDAERNLYILDSGNQRIRKVTPDGIIRTIAGNGLICDSGDGGPALSASFRFTFVDTGGLAIDPWGNLYVADSENNRIRRIDRSGVISTYATVMNVRAVTTAPNGDVYFARIDLGSPNAPKILRADASGTIIESWGSGTGFTEDGAPALTASYGFIERVKIDADTNIIYTDATAGRVRRIRRASGKLETLAGMGPALIGENGPATAAVLRNFNAALMLRGSTLLIGDGTSRLRAVDESGVIRTVAGRGLFGLPERNDFPAEDAYEIQAFGMAANASGDLLFADTHSIWRIDAGGTLRRFAGIQGGHGYAGDGGRALDAELLQPWDLATAAGGSLFIADTNNNRIRKVAADGVITTVAGSGPSNGFEQYGTGTTCGDHGPATNACINTPYGVAVDADGNLYVSENRERIRRIGSDGRITTFANVYATKMTFDVVGRLYTVTPDGVVRVLSDGTIERIAGVAGRSEPLSDGRPALEAGIYALGQASGLAIDGEGNVFFSDGGHSRIRAIRYGAVLAPSGAMIQASREGSVVRASVSDRFGRPAPGVRVDFATPETGATCTPSRRFAITDASGTATTTCISNCVAGSYSMHVRPVNGPASAMVNFTNTDSVCKRRAVRR